MSDSLTYTFGPLLEDQFGELFAVFQKFFPPSGWSGSYLRWQYYENPSGAAKVWVARKSGRIVASYAAIPHWVYADGRVAVGWRVQNVVTLPEHRGQGLYHRLAAVAAEELSKGDFPLNFAFPNERSRHGFIRIGWKAAFRVPLRTKVISGLPLSTNFSGIVTVLTQFDADAERIWDSHRRGLRFAVERSSAYLNWRYFSNPKSEYSSFRLETDKTVAILILKSYTREDGTRCSHLCDFFQSAPDSTLTESAFRQWLCFAVGLDCQEMSCWCVTGSGMEPTLCKAGFAVKEGFDRWVVLNANTSALENATTSRYDQESSWHLAMGDSDVY